MTNSRLAAEKIDWLFGATLTEKRIAEIDEIIASTQAECKVKITASTSGQSTQAGRIYECSGCNAEFVCRLLAGPSPIPSFCPNCGERAAADALRREK